MGTAGEEAAAGPAAGAEAAGADAVDVTGATEPITPADTLPLLVPISVSANVAMKNTVASTAVVRDKKLAEPVAPNKLPDAPTTLHHHGMYFNATSWYDGADAVTQW